MADNLTAQTTVATIPSGTVIRTDDLGAAGHVQYVKLLDGTNDGTAVIPGDATNGLDVDVTRLPALVAGTAIVGKVGIDQTTDGTTNLVAAKQSGTWNVATVTTVTTVAAVTAITNPLPAGTNLLGSVNAQPATSGGLLSYHVVSAASANAANVKASAGQVFAVTGFNNAAYPVVVQLHNNSGTPTAGTGVVRSFVIQAGVFIHAEFAMGLAFGTGIGIAIVKAATPLADSTSTAVAAGDCVVDVSYK